MFNFNNINTKERKVKKMKVSSVRERINQKKKHSPGVPNNTCPYIDLVKTALVNIGEAYDKMYTKGEASPMVDKQVEVAEALLEHVRESNETLRENSLYWYEEYKKVVGRKNSKLFK